MGFDQLMSICRGCLATERKMVKAIDYEAEFKDLTGITISPSDGLPQWLCYECVALLQKCVKFGNKVMKCHYILCQHVLDNVPLANDKDYSLPLTRTPIEQYDFSSTDTKEPEESFMNIHIVYDIEMPDTINIDNVTDKDGPVVCIYEDNVNEGKSSDENNDQNALNTLLISNITELMTEISRSTPSHHEERTEQGEVVKGNPVTDDIVTKIQKVQVNDEDPDNITIEVWCMDQENELRNKSPTYKSTQETQIGNEETPSGSACSMAGTGEAGTPWRHLQDHPYSILLSGDHGEPSRDNVTGASVNDNKRRNKKYYVCNECSKCFSRKADLTAHVHVHARKKPYKCNVCMKGFNSESYLKLHRRLHTGDKPYKCHVCSKSYNDSGNLNKHMFLHTGVKPYKCEICMSRFITVSNYKRHMELHNSALVYNCKSCAKSFKHKSYLAKHLRTHIHEKPYKCNVCLKSFSEKNAFDNHYRVHTIVKPYKCEVCNEEFPYKQSFLKHVSYNACFKSDVTEVSAVSIVHPPTSPEFPIAHTQKIVKCYKFK